MPAFSLFSKPFSSFECWFFKNGCFYNFHEFATLTIIVFQYIINFFILDSTIQYCFAPFVNKSAKDGFKSFVTALNKNNYTKEAKFYEQNIGAEAIEKKIDKDRLDIAMKSDWVSIKQAAEILGIIALERIEIDIANLLLDNGAVIYKE